MLFRSNKALLCIQYLSEWFPVLKLTIVAFWIFILYYTTQLALRTLHEICTVLLPVATTAPEWLTKLKNRIKASLILSQYTDVSYLLPLSHLDHARNHIRNHDNTTPHQLIVQVDNPLYFTVDMNGICLLLHLWVFIGQISPFNVETL